LFGLLCCEFVCLDDRQAKRVYKYLIGEAFFTIGKETPPCKFPLWEKGDWGDLIPISNGTYF
jgi:hypothetical protein